MKKIIKLFYIKIIFLILIQHSYAKYENKIILKIEKMKLLQIMTLKIKF